MLRPSTRLLTSLALVLLLVPRPAYPQSDAVRDLNGDGRIVIAGIGSSNSDPKSHLPDQLVCRGECPGLPLPIGGRWYTQLADFMPAEWQAVNLATAGMTARRLGGLLPDGPNQVNRALLYYGADVVLIAIGINDVVIDCIDGDCSAAPIAADILALRDTVIAAGRTAFVATVEPLFPREPRFHPVVPGIIADINARLRAAVEPERLLVHDDIVDPDDMTYADLPGFNDGLHPGDRGMRKWACDAATRLGLVGDGGRDCMPGPTAESLARTIERTVALLSRGELDARWAWILTGLDDARRHLVTATAFTKAGPMRQEIDAALRIVRRLAKRVRIADKSGALDQPLARQLPIYLEPLALELASLRPRVDR